MSSKRERFPRSALYKVLGPDLTSCHGGTGKWKVGKRRSVTGELVPCENGIHVCRDTDILRWLHTSLWLVWTSKEQVEASDKVVVRWATLKEKTPLNDRLLRLFAADCVERVIKNNDNPRIVNAIQIVRRYAFGLATQEELEAARDAAGAAARDAAWEAAGAAAWAAAGAAARDAAGAAARAAAWAAAWEAAGAAARAAAWAAAWEAAGEAAGAAARAAAWAAARAAEKEWQTAHLFDYLNGRVDLKALRRSVA